MRADELGRALADRFPDAIEWAARSPKRLDVSVPPGRLLEVARWLREKVEGCRLGTSTGIDLRERLGVFHHFAVNGSPLVITVKVSVAKPEGCVPSLAALIPAAAWIEREIHDLLGIVFEGHPDPRRLLKAREFSDDVLPLRRDFDVREFKEQVSRPPERERP